MTGRVHAQWFDGLTSRRREVRLSMVGDRLRIESEAGETEFVREVPLAQVQVSERLGSAARLLRFENGSFCEVRDHDGLDALLGGAGHRFGHVERWQRSIGLALSATIATGLVIAAAYVWGLPWAAERSAEHMPPQVARYLGRNTLEALDRGLLQPSKLDDARKAQLKEKFETLAQGELDPAPTLEFRSSPGLGANAFALPDGSVVLLDGLVNLAKDDDEILGVLAHEIGHVRHRHGLRMLVQGSAVAAAMTLWFGDVSALLAAVPTALLHARYSRAFEADADDYAIDLMHRRGISPARLADMLERLEASRATKQDDGGVCTTEKPAKDAPPAKARSAAKPATATAPPSKPEPSKDAAEPTRTAESGGAWDYLASHPATADRMRRLRAAALVPPTTP